MTLSASFRKKLVSVGLATGIFMVLGVLAAGTIDVPADQAILIGGLGGFAISAFEEFYVQGAAGRWMRAAHPAASILIYSVIVCVVFIATSILVHLLLGRLDELPAAYARLPITIPMVFAVSLVGVLALRVTGFIGAKTLAYLLVGKYHRPVIERKVFLFLDMRDSTATVEAIGPIKAKALIGKFLFDFSKPITDNEGDIYVYTGDGLIAMWDWRDAIRSNNIVRAVDAIYQSVQRERAEYLDSYGRVPEFRIGVHGGDVVISEQGDAKRAIGVYGDTINIAARMEQQAKALGEQCIFSAAVADALAEDKGRLEFIGEDRVKGISTPIALYKYRPRP